MTVALPVTISPPANTSSKLVCPFSSASIYPHLFNLSSGIDFVRIGFALVPIAIIVVSVSIKNSEFSIGIGLLRPDSSGSPNYILITSICLTLSFSSPINLNGFVKN